MSKRKGLGRTHNSTIIHPLTSEERKVGWGEEVVEPEWPCKL